MTRGELGFQDKKKNLCELERPWIHLQAAASQVAIDFC